MKKKKMIAKVYLSVKQGTALGGVIVMEKVMIMKLIQY
jgi:hypothetical protein